MRKLISFILAALLAFSCTAVLAEEAAADDNVCTYVVYNVTGEKVVELYLIDNTSGEKGENYAGEEGLADLVIVEIKGENYDGYGKTLSFKTESGYEAAFPTLHFENVPISLLPAPEQPEEGETDTVTGATPINFFVPIYTAHYWLNNQTGEKVTEATFTNNATQDVTPAWDEVDSIDGIAAGDTLHTWVNCDADKTGELEMTLKFVTESGYVGEFKTLHFENVTINLLSQDAMTGATQISFGMAPAEEPAE